MAWIEKNSFRSEADMFVLKNKCTIIPKVKYSVGDKVVRPIKMYKETDKYFGVPRHFFRKHNWNQEIESLDFKVAEGQPLLKNKTPIKLREYDQEPVAEAMLEALQKGEWGCGLMEAFVAFGKTVVSIELINRLGGNALVLVHSEALKDQWVERIKQFYPNARIGEIQANICNYKEKDIVVGMVQSLMTDSSEKYPPEIFRHFRTLVVDECHRMGSESFSKAAPKFSCKYMFGVSGTMRRNDGCVDVFKWTLGDITASADESLRVLPNIYLRETFLEFPRKEWQYLDKKTGLMVTRVRDMNEKNRAQQLNYLAESDERNMKVAVDIIKALRSGRNPLVMSERKSMLEKIAELVAALAEEDPSLCERSISHGFYVGGKSKATRKQELLAASRCDVVYATIQLAKEGIDIPRLETLFMASPLSDVEQLVGRICRPTIKWVNGKPIIQKKRHHPMVTDYIDRESSLFRALSFKRLAQYRSLGWKIIGRNF